MTDRRGQPSDRAAKRTVGPVLMVWAASSVFLAGLALQDRVPYEDLVLDPNYSSGIPWHVGLLSNLGVLGWTAAAASAFLGSWVGKLAGRRGAASMLLGGALLSTLLLLDDLFQLHVLVEPALGMPKHVAYLGYCLAGGTWVISQYQEIRRTRYPLLLAAAVALASSVIADVGLGVIGVELQDGQRLIVEDSAKFLGIVAWAQYFCLTTIDIVRSILQQLAEAQGHRRTKATNRSDASPTPSKQPSKALSATSSASIVKRRARGLAIAYTPLDTSTAARSQGA